MANEERIKELEQKLAASRSKPGYAERRQAIEEELARLKGEAP